MHIIKIEHNERGHNEEDENAHDRLWVSFAHNYGSLLHIIKIEHNERQITMRSTIDIEHIQVFDAEYRLFYRALVQKRPIILRSLLIGKQERGWRS